MTDTKVLEAHHKYYAYRARCEKDGIEPLNLTTWLNAQHWFVRTPPPFEVTERPQLGEMCKVSATAHKANVPHAKTNRVWQEWNFNQPIQAMYIGYRTAYDGYREWEDEVGYIFTQHAHREVWLFVKNERENPIHAFPCSVKRSLPTDTDVS